MEFQNSMVRGNNMQILPLLVIPFLLFIACSKGGLESHPREIVVTEEGNPAVNPPEGGGTGGTSGDDGGSGSDGGTATGGVVDLMVVPRQAAVAMGGIQQGEKLVLNLIPIRSNSVMCGVSKRPNLNTMLKGDSSMKNRTALPMEMSIK